ncbi:MAG TPA: hypothetical protein VFZ98_09670 [Vicinamibacterales bacterium]
MTDERRRILELLSQQKISVDEAQQLLNAVPPTARAAEAGEAGTKPKYFRIAIHRKAAGWPGDCDFGGAKHWQRAWQRDKDVNIRVPITLVRSGLRLGAMIPGLADDRMKARVRVRGVDVDLSKLDPAMLESMLDELGELNIDLDSGRAQIRITAE